MIRHLILNLIFIAVPGPGINKLNNEATLKFETIKMSLSYIWQLNIFSSRQRGKYLDLNFSIIFRYITSNKSLKTIRL